MSKPMQGLAAYLRCEAGGTFVGEQSSATLKQWAIEVDQAAQPDCRTCRYHHELGCHQYMSNMRDTARHCVNGDKYIEAPKVVLWRTEP